MIHEILSMGADNPKTGKELAALFGCNIRDITARIELERRQGFPICASTKGDNPGYYLAADKEELQDYCNTVHKRAAELYNTRRILLGVIKKLPDRTENPGEKENPGQ